ncbi:hypothetical protein ENSA5_31920 [Enhygromyxa salina]|uniref:DUF3829 domain-containing protein n=1 Tax=Enhygromyxa salina TaxID=215803 RepID=A0A2S9XXU0_9BACT|nr:DUF3829 domain-containing protein [Enhygromyxa salina]PRP97685.1 hypothetical protein ENSA5_31920 [Enhygromyxa salina]
MRLASAVVAVLALPTVGLSASGCHLFEEVEEQQPDDHDAEVDPADYAEEVDSKLRRFSACRDVVASVMVESWDRYSDQVDSQGTPKRKREGVYLRGISVNTFRSCQRVLEAAKTPPSMPVIESGAARIVAAGSHYAELTRTLAAYLDNEGWRDDQWARLSELDPQLRAAHDAWLTADLELQQAIDEAHINNDVFLLGVLESRRSALEVASRRLMIRARPMVRCMSDEAATAEQCQPLYDEFDQARGQFSTIYQSDPEAAGKVFWMSTFANDVEEFHAIAAEFQRKLGQRKPKLGDLVKLTDGYSSLVRDAETLDFDFP